MVKYSVFAPIYNEEGNIKKLYDEVSKVMNSLKEEWEFILVNDGSTDNSLAEMKKLKDVIVVDLMRNHGQAVAMDAGFKQAKGEIVISMDGDNQNDPKDIPRLLKKLEKENLDVVAGYRAKRKDPLWMIVITKVAKFLRGIFASDGVSDSGCTLRVYRRDVVKDLDLWGEMHRYIIALLKWRGARIDELKVNHRAREFGVTKYNWTKSAKGFVDLMYIWFWKKFSARPLHLFGIGGMGLMGLGFLSGLWTVYLKFFNNVSLSDSSWFVMTFFLFMVGLQFFTTGIMLDLMIRTYHNVAKESRYKIRSITKNGKKLD